MIVVDTDFLIFLLDPESTQAENRRPERVKYFIKELSTSQEEVVVATPSLAELVAGRPNRIDEILDELKGHRIIRIEPFDKVIAIETGDRIAAALAEIPESERLPGWRVAMKFDAMIASTAIVRGARAVYTMDSGLSKYLTGSTVQLILLDELPLPPEDPQGRMDV